MTGLIFRSGFSVNQWFINHGCSNNKIYFDERATKFTDHKLKSMENVRLIISKPFLDNKNSSFKIFCYANSMLLFHKYLSNDHTGSQLGFPYRVYLFFSRIITPETFKWLGCHGLLFLFAIFIVFYFVHQMKFWILHARLILHCPGFSRTNS